MKKGKGPLLKLYHFWSSTCSRKVRICLTEKELDWQSYHVDIVKNRDNLQEWYLKLNPNGVVPTLDHDGRIVTESNIIIEYLDESFHNKTLKPNDTYERALMRLWMDKAETIVHKNINVISWNKRHMPRMPHYSYQEHLEILEQFPNPEKRKMMIGRLENGVSEVEEQSAENRLLDFMDEEESALQNDPWLCGKTFSLADIAIAPFVERFEANGLGRLLDFGKRPKVGDWWGRLRARNSYDTTFAFQDPDT